MNKEQNRIAQLLNKVDELMEKQAAFQKEIEALRDNIHQLDAMTTESIPVITKQEETQPKEQPEKFSARQHLSGETPSPIKPETASLPKIDDSDGHARKKPLKIRNNIEKFIGEHLISKIGIIITVIGVAIGVKYAIDHDLISPWARIILGYLAGLVLFGFAFRLKKQYQAYSAILLSGSMAILYFITFAAYSFYNLLPAELTFTLMVFITVLTVAASLHYNKPVIAHFGMVGAYAIPFLLDDGSGKVVFMFTYMAIINTGILAIAFRKYWKSLYYSSFLLTWLIFLTWFIPAYNGAVHFTAAWTFLSIFFVTFYILFLAYKLLKKEKFQIEEILLLLANASIFFGVGYAVLNQMSSDEKFLGLFTLGNGLLHGIVSILVFRQKQADRNLYYFTAGMAVAFLTIAIPVQLDGNWVTMLWSVEATALFWIGRRKHDAVYELLSYPLMVLAFFSITTGWPQAYQISGSMDEVGKILPLINLNFLTSLIVVASFTYISILNGNRKFTSPLAGNKSFLGLFNFMVAGMLMVVVYFAFYMEIVTYWDQLYNGSKISVDTGASGMIQYHNEDLPEYKTICILVYSLFFFSVFSFLNILKLKKTLAGYINIGFNIIATGVFLTLGLIALGTLRDNYLSQVLSEYYYRGIFNVGIRYVSFGFLAFMLLSMYRYTRQEFLDIDFHKEYDILLHLVILTIAGNELINWMDIFGSEQSYKLGLSILCGVYSLFLIVLGIWKKKLHLRIAAIILFAATLAKLFVYDLSSLGTIAKTIIFIILGVLLLIIAFLYNKYKKLIFEEGEG